MLHPSPCGGAFVHSPYTRGGAFMHRPYLAVVQGKTVAARPLHGLRCSAENLLGCSCKAEVRRVPIGIVIARSSQIGAAFGSVACTTV